MDKPIYRFLHLVFALGTLHMLVLVGLEVQRLVGLRREVALVFEPGGPARAAQPAAKRGVADGR
ncbi:MAG: septum formation initiator [Meiothermus sp.]|uniref:septum formation initiator n=1 Tax=Meiothermus sp. TaxID=1955249 RepID=UPI00298F38C5|nr:septum formation initiator [Meiothermus sp.]MDW8482533.1 septum formation initiator [Meiothermus sp.]